MRPCQDLVAVDWEKWRLKIQIGSMHEGLCSKYACKRARGRHKASSNLECSERWLGHPCAEYGIRRRRTAANELRGRGRRRRLWRRLRVQGSLNLTMQALACALVRRHDPRLININSFSRLPTRESRRSVSLAPLRRGTRTLSLGNGNSKEIYGGSLNLRVQSYCDRLISRVARSKGELNEWRVNCKL